MNVMLKNALVNINIWLILSMSIYFCKKLLHFIRIAWDAAYSEERAQPLGSFWTRAGLSMPSPQVVWRGGFDMKQKKKKKKKKRKVYSPIFDSNLFIILQFLLPNKLEYPILGIGSLILGWLWVLKILIRCKLFWNFERKKTLNFIS